MTWKRVMSANAETRRQVVLLVPTTACLMSTRLAVSRQQLRQIGAEEVLLSAG
jgi:hypothetical protein